MKKLVFTLFLFLTIVLLFGVIFECVLRLGTIENPRYEHMQIQGKQDRAKHKLLILGDSFMVKQAKVKFDLLGKSLAQNLGTYDIAVFNAATSGTGPFEYLAEMKQVGVDFKPDIVLLSYYIGNDLTNIQNNPQFNPDKPGLAIDSAATRAKSCLTRTPNPA